MTKSALAGAKTYKMHAERERAERRVSEKSERVREQELEFKRSRLKEMRAKLKKGRAGAQTKRVVARKSIKIMAYE